jgi:hypothetical protein
LVGSNHSQVKDSSYLIAALREIKAFLADNGAFAPERVALIVGYIQNSEIKSSGDFICRKDTYNSKIEAAGAIRIFGACRACSLTAGNKIYVYELGSTDGGGDTVLKLPATGHLTAEYCHSTVKIFIGGEYIPIDQNYRKLDVYIEKGKVWVDKLKWL